MSVLIHRKEAELDSDIYSKYDIILVVSTYSATAPLTAKCKEFGFRGATLHGLNQIILDTGLAVDYQEVSEEAEKLRLALTKAVILKLILRLRVLLTLCV